MKKTPPEDRKAHAERLWRRVMEQVERGICDRNLIVAAMNQLNNADLYCINEGRRDLLGSICIGRDTNGIEPLPPTSIPVTFTVHAFRRSTTKPRVHTSWG